MSLLHRFRQTAGAVWIDQYGKQDGLAAALREMLRLDENIDLGPAVCRYLGGEAAYSGFFEPIHLLFWQDVVAGDYPLSFLIWLKQAYACYDTASGKRDLWKVRTLLAEARFLFHPKRMAQYTFPRAEAACRLMRGIAVGLQHRTLGVQADKIKDYGLPDLKAAIRLFLTHKPGEIEYSRSDKYHVALATHMADWLLSELNDEDFRKEQLTELNNTGRASGIRLARRRNWKLGLSPQCR